MLFVSCGFSHDFGESFMMGDFVMSDFVSDLVGTLVVLKFVSRLMTFKLVGFPFMRPFGALKLEFVD